MAPLTLKNFRSIPGTAYGTPKELWDFRLRAPAGPPRRVARHVLAANADLLGLEGVTLDFSQAKVKHSLAARHVIIPQRFRRLRLYRAYVTVHIAKDQHVYLVKNRAVPAAYTKPDAGFTKTRDAAERIALRSVSRRRRGGLQILPRVERMWFPRLAKDGSSSVRPAYCIHVRRARPRADWIVFVDGHSGAIIRKYDNRAERTGVAKVFDPNPVLPLLRTPHPVKNGRQRVFPDIAYNDVRLSGLGDNGRLDGSRVTTNLTRDRIVSSARDFVRNCNEPGFEEVMAYFHIDRAMSYLEDLGYRGSRRLFYSPIPVNARGTREDNSEYSPHTRSIMYGTGGVDDAEDAEIILHEFGHAVQDAICPQFGQSKEAAAMGEGFGDYFAVSFFAAEKPEAYRESFGSWDGIDDPTNRPPCVRRVDSAMTYESFDHGPDGDEHDNGQIWSATLWDIWLAVGRPIADRIIIESHFQLDGHTTFARGARAIIDADRNLFGGRHLEQLRRIFRRRGIGPVE